MFGVRMSGARVKIASVSRNHAGPSWHRYYGHVTEGILAGTLVGFYEGEVTAAPKDV